MFGSLEDAAEFYELYQNSDRLLSVLKREYQPGVKPLDIHEKLWKLPHVQWIYTTNFDCLVEDALGRPKQPPKVITQVEDFSNVPREQRIVFKPHGCARRSMLRQEFVITRNDYLNYSHRRTLEMLKTLYDISTKTFLFLGYSLQDLNMRHIISEANRITKVNSYAVLQDISGPEARYWQKQGVTLIRSDTGEFISEILAKFPPYEYEWEKKVDERIEEKEEIAQKALQALKAILKRNQDLCIIIDAGSTTLTFTKALAKEVKAGSISLDKARVVTNSPPTIEALKPVLERIAGGDILKPSVTTVGGSLRFDTRAYTPNASSAEFQLRPFKENRESGMHIVAFIGATSIDSKKLKTKTREEVAIKKAYIETAEEIFVLVDHSKIRNLSRSDGYMFSEWNKQMTIITDREEAMKVRVPKVKKLMWKPIESSQMPGKRGKNKKEKIKK